MALLSVVLYMATATKPKQPTASQKKSAIMTEKARHSQTSQAP